MTVAMVSFMKKSLFAYTLAILVSGFMTKKSRYFDDELSHIHEVERWKQQFQSGL